MINIIDSNNYNSNNNFETLFWKVIRNKYLFKIILKFIIVIIKEIKSKNPNIKSYKFIDIKSVTWMIQNGALGLLEYKLLKREELELSCSINSIDFSQYCFTNLIYYLINDRFENNLLNGESIEPFSISTMSKHQLIEIIMKVDQDRIKKINQVKDTIHKIFYFLFKNYKTYINCDILKIILLYSTQYRLLPLEKELKLKQLELQKKLNPQESLQHSTLNEKQLQLKEEYSLLCNQIQVLNILIEQVKKDQIHQTSLDLITLFIKEPFSLSIQQHHINFTASKHNYKFYRSLIEIFFKINNNEKINNIFSVN